MKRWNKTEAKYEAQHQKRFVALAKNEERGLQRFDRTLIQRRAPLSLHNFSNTCYVNVLLQLWFHTIRAVAILLPI